jgi:hypothetical protein
MVFDVESVGLHGEGFAVGWVVVHRAAGELEQGLLCCAPDLAFGSEESLQWVAEHAPAMKTTHAYPGEVRAAFWKAWLQWKAKGAVLVADCCWPVEARFLAACVADEPAQREWEGPYPLHDLASVLLALGRDPLATNERRPDELPAHHPLADARQSARLLVEALAAQPAADERVVNDLAALVRQLAWLLRRRDPDSTLPARAVEYLKRCGLEGSPLRAETGATGA